MHDDKKRILIVLPRQLGDVLLGTPIAQVLRDKYPNAQIDWWSHPMAKQILEQNPFLNRLFFYPVLKKSKTNKNSVFKVLIKNILFLYENIQHLIKIRKQKYDIVIDAMNNPRTAVLSLVTGAPVRISFSTSPIRNLVFNKLIPREDLNGIYLGHARLKLLQPLNINLQAEQCLKLHPIIPISLEDKEKVQDWLMQEKEKLSHTKIRIKQTKSQIFDYILLSPTHRRSVRRWPAASYVELAWRMIQKYQSPIVWLWGPTEDVYVHDMHKALQLKLKENNLAEEFSLFPPLFSLREAGFLSEQALIWIGNSNGLSHIAVAAGAKTLELHGPTSPVSWCHPDKAKHLALQRETGCIQCESNICRLSRRECLEDLSVEKVFQTALILIEKSE
ncbi:glycosyltransferase family 9 protein [Fluviispira sanaruensis]|uniref:Glycosyltransferase family 9 protein n=1 Tax=Fluviispira sanaruensis TaxID=2493639 RepID=A0A4P2VNC8_FLUSA|nr:glycosyltransferase family 9 protein [Fluviispira sanaruensis]BBH53480.1 glycosyltransferase family 9 protein [Fluviispira sanaruensis]